MCVKQFDIFRELQETTFAKPSNNFHSGIFSAKTSSTVFFLLTYFLFTPVLASNDAAYNSCKIKASLKSANVVLRQRQRSELDRASTSSGCEAEVPCIYGAAKPDKRRHDIPLARAACSNVCCNPLYIKEAHKIIHSEIVYFLAQ